MSEAARREQILQAAERLLEHYGPQKTTVADVAREAGIGVGSVYLEFPSKEALIEALSRARHETVLAAMRAAATRADTSWAQRLEAVMQTRLEAYLAQASGGAHARDLFHCANPAVKSASLWFHQEEQTLVTELLNAGAAAGEFAMTDPQLTARVILRAYSGFTPPWILCADPKEIRLLASGMHALVLHGVLTRAAPPRERDAR
jgi:AcrR family transcriptional regulator